MKPPTVPIYILCLLSPTRRWASTRRNPSKGTPLGTAILASGHQCRAWAGGTPLTPVAWVVVVVTMCFGFFLDFEMVDHVT